MRSYGDRPHVGREIRERIGDVDADTPVERALLEIQTKANVEEPDIAGAVAKGECESKNLPYTVESIHGEDAADAGFGERFAREKRLRLNGEADGPAGPIAERREDPGATMQTSANIEGAFVSARALFRGDHGIRDQARRREWSLSPRKDRLSPDRTRGGGCRR